MNEALISRLHLAVAVLATASALAACTSSTSGHAVAGAPTPVARSSSQAPRTTSSGAGNSGTPKAAAAGVDVCGLLSSSQASSINNVTYGSATRKQLTAGWDQCEYANTGTHTDPVDIQPLEVSVLSLADCWSQLQSIQGPGTPVSGVGDSAFGYQIGLDVKVGKRCIDVRGMTHAEFSGDYSHDAAMARILIGQLH